MAHLPHHAARRPYGGIRRGSELVDARSITVASPPARAFAAIRSIGGDNGWYAGDAAWRLRGTLDALVGGPGPRRGRRHPHELRVGDPVDTWRVEAYETDRLLVLRAEMRVPGRAWLRYDVRPAPGGCEITQTAIFEPDGRLGLLYWYAIWPLHDRVFERMVRALGARADRTRPAPDSG